MDELIALITAERWEEALSLMVSEQNKWKFDDTLAVLMASIYEHYGEIESYYKIILQGISVNPSNYELYFMLGNYWMARNIDLAYLCYENAVYWCDNEADAGVLKQMLDSCREQTNVKNYSFVILSYNQIEYTKACIESIRENCAEGSYEIVVVDNASKDNSVEWLREQSDIKLVKSEVNLGFPGGCNLGIANAAQENDIFLLNNDTLMMPNTMFTLRMGLYRDAANGAVGCVTNNASNYQTIDKSFSTIDEYRTYAIQNNVPNDCAYEYKTKLIGFAMLIRRSVLDQVGELDERFAPGNFEDDDLSVRIALEGYRNVLCHNSFLLHFGSVSFEKEGRDKYIRLLQTNKEKFKEKWNSDLSYYQIVRTDIIEMLASTEPPSDMRVLEAGCGTGETLSRIKYLYSEADVHGVELTPLAARIGSVKFDIRQGNIEEIKQEDYSENSFDYIIFGDVLEHLYDPEKVLIKSRTWLQDSGRIIASIPNMLNAEVIYHLLQGTFTYNDSGIRDFTHLRFFTLYEIMQLFTRAGYEIEKITPIKFSQISTDIDPAFFDKLTQIPGVVSKAEFDVYQYIVCAKKKSADSSMESVVR